MTAQIVVEGTLKTFEQEGGHDYDAIMIDDVPLDSFFDALKVIRDEGRGGARIYGKVKITVEQFDN